jgi:hypothetical protein
MENNLYIKILKYASDNEFFYIDDLFNDLGIERDSVTATRIIDQIHNGILFSYGHVSNFKVQYKDEKKVKLIASVEDFFRLIEYTELKEARESSIKATWFASKALLISITAFIVSTTVSIISLCYGLKTVKYKYKTVTYKKTNQIRKTNDILSTYGNEGWELVTKDGEKLIFKKTVKE